ncbi:SEC-C motif-containing protein [Allofrancisella inopinata]|uniref:SEC-C metal-binding domain-containing protein n=1 Tax=Allofrancisella inopinata TaxID=1085647 RepID=UPI0010D429B2|nr:SEC-C metal-binding domain-containing protein [Allofrancisella inopinata]TDT65220.1 SEC-C motif-containing protein [Allofrancisella inopinata]
MKIGRNEPCICGSGKKYKKCCYGKEDLLSSKSNTSTDGSRKLMNKHQQELVRKNKNIKVKESDGFKMSDIIKEFASDMLDYAETDDQIRMTFQMAIVSWNLCVMLEREQDGSKQQNLIDGFLVTCKKAQRSPEADDGVFEEILEHYRIRKQKYFSHINRFIADYKLEVLRSGDINLSIASTET